MSSSYSPFRKNQNPSGRVFMAPATRFSGSARFPTMSIPLIASRRPSSTRNASATRPSSMTVESMVTRAR